MELTGVKRSIRSHSLTNVQSMVIFPRGSKEYIKASEELHEEVQKCDEQKLKFDNSSLQLLRALGGDKTPRNIAVIALINQVPNIHDMSYDSISFRDLEKVFFYDTGRNRIVSKFTFFQRGLFDSDGYLVETFLEYFLNILESPTLYPMHVKSFTLNAMLQSFYGQNGSALIDGALPLNVEEININIERYLSTVSNKLAPSDRIVRVLSYIRCYCARLPGVVLVIIVRN